MYYRWKPYVPSAERRREAERAVARLKKKGKTTTPVILDGRAIAKTFWGRAWCDNLERYSDYSNRLPRGRTYVRNGSVIDLKIAPGEVTALVSGSSIYTVRAQITAVPKVRWNSVCADCAGAIDSLVELLQGHFSKGVMERICRQDTGLFPSPKEIRFTCSCPDWATMCKHVAAVLYGVGARLDQNPELLFALRKVDHNALVVTAGRDVSLGGKGPATGKVLESAGLAEMFGIELVARAEEPTSTGTAKRGAKKKSVVAIERGARSKKPTRTPKKSIASPRKRIRGYATKRQKTGGPRSSRRGRD